MEENLFNKFNRCNYDPLSMDGLFVHVASPLTLYLLGYSSLIWSDFIKTSSIFFNVLSIKDLFFLFNAIMMIDGTYISTSTRKVDGPDNQESGQSRVNF